MTSNYARHGQSQSACLDYSNQEITRIQKGCFDIIAGLLSLETGEFRLTERVEKHLQESRDKWSDQPLRYFKITVTSLRKLSCAQCLLKLLLHAEAIQDGYICCPHYEYVL